MNTTIHAVVFMKPKISLLFIVAIFLNASWLFAQTSTAPPPEPLTVGGKSYYITSQSITVKEYCIFLNAVAVIDDYYNLFDEKMGSACIIRTGSPGNYYYSFIEGTDDDSMPYLNWFDKARFCNWIQNGELSNDQDPNSTEHGIYDLYTTANGLPMARMPKKKSLSYFLSGDAKDCSQSLFPDSFFDNDPWLNSNDDTALLDIVIPGSFPGETVGFVTPSSSIGKDIKNTAKDTIETVIVSSVAALFAMAGILLVGALTGYAVAAFIGTGLAARSSSDKVITKLTTKNGVEPWWGEGLAIVGSIAIGMLVGTVLISSGFVAAPLVLAIVPDGIETAVAAEQAETLTAQAVPTIADQQGPIANAETYVLGLFRRALGDEASAFQKYPRRTLFASLCGSALGAHLSTHLDPYVAKAIGNTEN